ncbi:MAG: GGDEF domain-containing protein [Wenzhouxiangella sp.]
MSANPIISMTGYSATRGFEPAGLIGNDPDRADLFDFLIALQTSLEVPVLLETFSLRLQADYAHRGVRLETLWADADETAREFMFGQSGGRCRRMLLHVGGHELGWMEIFSSTPPNTSEQRIIDRLLACLIHPLQNAIRFHRLSRQAMLDDLTGVGNRAALNRALGHEIARAERREDGAPLALMLLDLDGFKELNDRLGHLVGDEGLRQFARVLRKHLRDSDQLFRYGGDEFVVILPDADASAGREIGERLHQRLINECNDPVVRATIGVAQWRRGMSGKELFEAADQAMYARKQQKRAAQASVSTR